MISAHETRWCVEINFSSTNDQGFDISSKMSEKMRGFRSYGILAVPVALLIGFALFGTRISRGRIHPAVNVCFIINTMVTTVLCVGYMPTAILMERLSERLVNCIFVPVVLLNFALLCYTHYKTGKNLNSLLEDIVEHRQSVLKVIHKVWIFVLLCVPILCMLYTFGITVEIVLQFLQLTDDDVRRLRPIVSLFHTTKQPKVDRVIHAVAANVLINCGWMSILATCFLLATIAIVLSTEFQTCVAKLRSRVKEEGFLSEENLFKSVERYNQLVTIVNSVDTLFSRFVVLFLLVSLGLQCAAAFGIIIEKGPVHHWMMGLINSTATAAVLIPPLVILHSQVT